MKTEKLFVIYSYISSKNNPNIGENKDFGPHYYITHIFDENGNIDNDILKNNYEDIFIESKRFFQGEFIGPFESLTILNRYSFEVLKELKGENVIILSSDEYNSILERSETSVEIKERMEKNGKMIENQGSRKRSTLFEKIFR